MVADTSLLRLSTWDIAKKKKKRQKLYLENQKSIRVEIIEIENGNS